MLKPLLFGLLCLITPPLSALPTSLHGGPGQWELRLDGKPFHIKGVGCAKRRGQYGTNYLAHAEALGANAVRTWSLEHTDRPYLDEAHQRGLQVNVGIWLPYPKAADGKQAGFSYRKPGAALEKLQKQILDAVAAYKNHPAVMMWTVGNEVFYVTEDKREQAAFKAFLRQLLTAIKQEDPRHLLSYAAAGWRRARHLRDVPELDILGLNVYGDVYRVRWKLKQIGETRPFVLTELGPIRPEDSARDVWELPVAASDLDKADSYRHRLLQTHKIAHYTPGAFAFMLGDPKADDQLWWPLTFGDEKRLTYHTVRELYSGQKPQNLPPLCGGVHTEDIRVKQKGTLRFQVPAVDPEGDALQYRASLWPHDSWRKIKSADLLKPQYQADGPRFAIPAPKRRGRYSIIASVADGQGNVCLSRGSVRVIKR